MAFPPRCSGPTRPSPVPGCPGRNPARTLAVLRALLAPRGPLRSPACGGLRPGPSGFACPFGAPLAALGRARWLGLVGARALRLAPAWAPPVGPRLRAWARPRLRPLAPLAWLRSGPLGRGGLRSPCGALRPALRGWAGLGRSPGSLFPPCRPPRVPPPPPRPAGRGPRPAGLGPGSLRPGGGAAQGPLVAALPPPGLWGPRLGLLPPLAALLLMVAML